MKKIIIALVITALIACALVSCVESDNDGSVAESSQTESTVSNELSETVSETDESEISDESETDESENVPDESNTETSEPENDELEAPINAVEDTSGFKAEMVDEEELEKYDDYYSYDLNNENGALVLLTVEEPIYCVQIHTVDMAAGEDGESFEFVIEETHTNIGQINKDRPLAASLEFPWNYATTAISFLDKDGNLHCYTISESTNDSVDLIYGRENVKGLIVTAQYIEFDETDYGELGYHVYYDGLDSSMIVFRTTETISDFKIYDLDVTDHWNNGTDGPLYKINKELYSLDRLTPDKPLAAQILFAGLVPQRAISYKDGDGNTRYFTLDISAENGMLLFAETELETE